VEDAKQTLALKRKAALPEGFVKVVQMKAARANATQVGAVIPFFGTACASGLEVFIHGVQEAKRCCTQTVLNAWPHTAPPAHQGQACLAIAWCKLHTPTVGLRYEGQHACFCLALASAGTLNRHWPQIPSTGNSSYTVQGTLASQFCSGLC
jgi:hypothetical protein